MLVHLFWALIVAGGSAMVVIWVFSVKAGVDVVRAGRQPGERPGPATYATLALWPFGARNRSGIADDQATLLTKMLVGFFAALLVVAGSAAVYSNLTYAPPPPAAQTDQ